MHVLIVEDEQQMANLLKDTLAEEGHVVTVAADGECALDFIRAVRFDVVVLDVMLPRLSGLEVVSRARAAGIRTPVLMLTARDRPSDIVKALDGGADDYLTKPFPLEVLLARIRAVSRRGQIQQPVCLTVSGLSLNTATRETMRDGRAISLTPREYSLLELLMRNKGRVLTRTQIVEAVWGCSADIEENTLDAFIRLLRNKVEQTESPRLIRTVRGIGYCLREPS